MSLVQHDAPFPHWTFTAAGGDQLRVVPERGGLLTGWRCGGVERLYFDAERFADPSKSVRGGIPLLFPVCGNLPDGQLHLEQGSFAMAQHGFARDLPWTLTALDDGCGIRLELCDSAASRGVFPFAFTLSLEYRLEPQALAIRALVRHTPEPSGQIGAMPFAFGLHPYFAVDALSAARLEGLAETCFDHLTAGEHATAMLLQQLERGVDLRVDREAGRPLDPRLIGAAACGSVALQAEAPFDHVVVWTDPPRPMVCLEPWTSLRGQLGLSLAPGEERELRCRYRLLA